MLRLAVFLAATACTAPEEHHDIVYDDRLGDAGKLDVYLPRTDMPAPAVMFIHGGSWKAGDKSVFAAAGRRLADSGFAVASINYRLLPDGVFPNNIEDCLCALAFLRGHADEYGIDPERIVAMGYSAGAHLAGLVGLAADRPELAPDCAAANGPIALPAAVIPASGPQDMRTFWNDAGDKSGIEAIFGGSPADLPDAYDLGSPRFHVRPGAPPFLIMADAIDFGGIYAMRDALAADGNDVRLLQIAGSLHILEQHDDGAYEAGVSSETPEAWLAIEDFLYRTVAQ